MALHKLKIGEWSFCLRDGGRGQGGRKQFINHGIGSSLYRCKLFS